MLNIKSFVDRKCRIYKIQIIYFCEKESVKNNDNRAHQALSFYIQFGSLMQFNVRAELKGDSVGYENG